LFLHTAPRIAPELDEAVKIEVPLQPCIRDVRHDHVLFVGDEVTGIIDFGSARYDSVAADVARLLDEFVGDEADRRRVALAAYERVRPLDAAEHRLVDVYDHSAALLGGMLWLDWIYLEGRSFESLADVAQKLGRFSERLTRLGGTP
jgi:homoserine kinase type II